MKKINYSFNKVFFDSKFSDTFSGLCIKNNIIKHDIFGDEVQFDERPLTGEKKILQSLVLFEKIDCSPTIYDCEELIERGLISEDSFCCSEVETTNIYETQAVSIMSAYKKDIINYLIRDYKGKLKYLQSEKIPSHDYWRKRIYNKKDVYQVRITDNFSVDLEQEYYSLISNLDQLYALGVGYEMFIDHVLYYDQISTLLGIRNNIAYALMSSDKESSSYMSKLLLGEKGFTSPTPAENIYAFFKTRLPDEVNILPNPQTMQDVWRMRQHPALASFRKVMSEWDYYINHGDITAAEKIKKDIIKANQYMEKLEKVKKCTQSPYIRTGYFISGFFPILSCVLNVISFTEPIITDMMMKKHSWTHLNSK